MNERPKPDDDAPSSDDPPPVNYPSPEPEFPKPLKARRAPKPDIYPNNAKVTPLDEDKNLEGGIEVKET